MTTRFAEPPLRPALRLLPIWSQSERKWHQLRPTRSALESRICPHATPPSGLITRRSRVRIPPPLYGSRLSPGGFRAYGETPRGNAFQDEVRRRALRAL